MPSSMLSGLPVSIIDGVHFDPGAEPLAIEGRRFFTFLSARSESWRPASLVSASARTSRP